MATKVSFGFGRLSDTELDNFAQESNANNLSELDWHDQILRSDNAMNVMSPKTGTLNTNRKHYL